MTAWGTAPARGRLRICGTCGTTLAFVESGRPGRTPQAALLVIHAIESHLHSSTRCWDTSTFAGREVVACRCLWPLPLPREEGLLCGRCEGLIAPEVAASPPAEPRARRPSRGTR
jgi:hypothetical protein